jgi:hypothetical protein
MKRGTLFSLVLLFVVTAVSAAAVVASAAGGGTVSGTVLSYRGAAQTSTWVEWGAADTHGIYSIAGGALTDGSGAYTITGVGAAAGTGELWVHPPGTDDYLRRFGLTFADPGTTTLDFRPGKLNFTTDRATSWRNWKSVRVVTFGSDALSSTSAQTVIGSTAAGGVSAAVKALPDTVTSAVVYYWPYQAAEWTPGAPVTITAGVTVSDTVTVSQAAALRLRVAAPFWRSGKPGSTVALAVANWPAAATAHFYAAPRFPAGGAATHFALAFTSVGTQSQKVTLHLPTTARPGYAYDFTAERTDSGSHLSLTASFQVCTLKASATTIARGSAIRLSGVVPTQGHWGGAKGLRKVVTIFKRTTVPTIGQPTVWDATREGWQLADTSLANAYGNYTSAVFRPVRTTWYVVRYPGDAWYWRAFTSVIKVTVH